MLSTLISTPVFRKYAGSIVRLAILLAGLKINVSDAELDRVIEVTTIAAVAIWSLWQKAQSQKEVNTALALPKGSAWLDIVDVFRRKQAPPASVPADVVPQLKGKD